jgi:erythromycin esterase
MVQAIEASGTGQTNAYRDQAMAGNVRWLADTAHPGEKIILWAHNAHVAATPGMMGGHLRAALGNSLVIIGLASHHGTVRARPMSAGAFDPAVSPTGIALAQPRPDSLDDMLNQVGKPYFALDLRKARAAGGALAAWLAEPRWETSIGSAYDPTQPGALLSRLADIYDALIFIAESNASAALQ